MIQTPKAAIPAEINNESVYLHSNVAASGNVAAARQITVGRIPANVNANRGPYSRGSAKSVRSPTWQPYSGRCNSPLKSFA